MVVRLIVEDKNLLGFDETTQEWESFGKLPKARRVDNVPKRMRWLDGAYLTPEQQERERYDKRMKTA